MVRLLHDLLARWIPGLRSPMPRAPKYDSFVCPACHVAIMYNRHTFRQELVAQVHTDVCIGGCLAPSFGRYCPICNYAGRS